MILDSYMLVFLRYIYIWHMWCHFVLFVHFWLLDWTTMFQDSVSTLMYHFIFGMTTWWWYISMLSPYLCSNVFIWCYCCFKCLKFWKNECILYFLMFADLTFADFLDFFVDVVEKLYSGPLLTFSTLQVWSPLSIYLCKHYISLCHFFISL